MELHFWEKRLQLIFDTDISSISHHTTTEVGLDLFWFHIFDVQNVQLSFGPIQDPLTIQHALLKVSRLLKELVLCRDLPQLSLYKAIKKSYDLSITDQEEKAIPSIDQ